MSTPTLFGFGAFLTVGIPMTVLSVIGYVRKLDKALPSEADRLHQECLRLRQALETQATQLRQDVNQQTFEQLQTLLTNYPSARKMAETKPDLSAQNLMPLLAPLDSLLKDWGYQPIGQVWESTPFDPKLHQPDNPAIAPGDIVYVRFVGYRQGDKILCPAKVSQSLPLGGAA